MRELTVCALLLSTGAWACAQYDREPDTFYPPEDEVQASLQRFLSLRKLGAFEGMLKRPEIEAERARFAADPEGYQRGFRETADYWRARSDDFLRAMLPAENPHMLVPGYALGCPLHLGGVSTLQPIWGRPNHFRCTVGREEWGPGMEVTNPGTGEAVTITDDGSGWQCPEGFPNPGTYWFVAAYRLSLIGTLTSRPYRPWADFDGPVTRAAIWCLGYLHAISGEPDYAHKVFVILTRLADVYRNYTSLHNWRTYPARAYIEDHNFEPNNIHNCLEAYDMCFEALDDDAQILEWFAQTRDDPDLNDDGRVDADDIRYHIERNLFGYMYEYLHRAIPLGRGNTRTTQVRSMMEMALNFRHDALFEESLNGRYGIANLITNCIYRDGRFYEDSTGYSVGVNASYLQFADFIERFRGRETYPEGVSADEALGPRLARIRTFGERADCAGRLPLWGDGGNARTPRFSPHDQAQPSVLFGDIGYGIMRSIGPPEEQLHLCFYFAQSGAGHGHTSQLMIKPIRFGYDFSADLGYPHNLSSPKRHEWYSCTTTHNCVIVDEMEQRTGCTGSLDLYADAGWLQLTAAQSRDAYESADLYHRTAAIVSMGDDAHYIVDIFRVRGGERRDWIYHMYSGEEFEPGSPEPPDTGERFRLALGGNPPMQPLPGTLAGPDVEWMADTGNHYGDSVDDQPDRKSGYSYIRALRRTSAEGDWSCRWYAGGEGDGGLALWMAGGPGRTLFRGSGEGQGAPTRSPWDTYVVARDDSEATGSDESVFCAVFEPFRGEPRIEAVQWLTLAEDSPTEGMPAAVRVTTPEGSFVVFSSLERGPLYTFTDGREQWHFQGRFHAQRVLDGGAVETVDVDPGRAEPLEGTVEEIDFGAVAVRVSSPTPLPEGDALAGRPIIFDDPAWPKNAIFTVEAVTRVGDGNYLVELTDPGFETAVGTVDEVDAEGNSVFTRDHLEKLFNCHYLYDGKPLYTADLGRWFTIETARTGYFAVGDVTVRFREPGAATQFAAGDRFIIMDVCPGAGFRIPIVMVSR